MSLLATKETLRAAFTSLWSHRLRSALTTLGIVIGVASVIVVMQLMRALDARIMKAINRSGTRTLVLSAWSSEAWRQGKVVRFQPVTKEVVSELRELVPEIRTCSPEYYIYRIQMVSGQNTRRVIVHAIDENGLGLSGMELAAGRAFTPMDCLHQLPVVILGGVIAEEMGLTAADLGKTFTLNGQTAELVGILQKEGDVPFMPKEEGSEIWGTDGQVLCPYGSFKQITRPWMIENTDWRISVDDHLPLIAAEDLLKANLRRVRGLRGDDADNFQLETNRKLVEQMEKTTRTLMLGSAAMVSISLLVGGIGVMNIMLVSVTERTREIGIRKALGARKRAILAQFLVEAVVLCLAGGLFGILSGLGLGSALSRWVMHQVGAVPFWTLGAALGVPILVGLTFGLYPANRAAGLDAIESLRYE